MDILKIIAELRAERAHLDEALATLERLSLHLKPRRGRPPGWSRPTTPAISKSGNGNGSTNGASRQTPAV
jgi:hypothetical protein